MRGRVWRKEICLSSGCSVQGLCSAQELAGQSQRGGAESGANGRYYNASGKRTDNIDALKVLSVETGSK